MRIVQTELPGVLKVELDVHRDERGFVVETWRQDVYISAGLPALVAQDNLSFSKRGVLRGLHYQHPHSQAKLIQVVAGEILDVAVDIRHDSPNFGHWVGVKLSSDDGRQLYIPEGFAHGFCVVSESALVSYKASNTYHPECDGGIAWDDPQIGIHWPVREPILSARDRGHPRLSAVLHERLPSMP